MPRRKVLKVVVDVTLNAVTCPGVVLPDQASVFLNVDVFGECKKTECLPAVFPFLFHEKMRFEKTFHRATDPVQVANALAADIVRVELVQLSYPAGELLACYQENAREFLFPTPRVSPTYPGVDREVLLNRAENFPGIAPKLEFSSRTTIKEVTARGTCLVLKSKKEKQQQQTVTKVIAQTPPMSSLKKKSAAGGRLSSPSKSVEFASTKERGRCEGGRSRKSRISRPTASSSSKCRGSTPPAHTSKSPAAGARRYCQSTISSRARSPSPYTRRRMAQLSVQDPFESAVAERPFRTELEERPDFVVRKSPSPTFPPEMSSSKTTRRSAKSRAKSPTRRQRSRTTNNSSPNYARKSKSQRSNGKSTCPNDAENNLSAVRNRPRDRMLHRARARKDMSNNNIRCPSSCREGADGWCPNMGALQRDIAAIHQQTCREGSPIQLAASNHFSDDDVIEGMGDVVDIATKTMYHNQGTMTSFHDMASVATKSPSSMVGRAPSKVVDRCRSDETFAVHVPCLNLEGLNTPRDSYTRLSQHQPPSYATHTRPGIGPHRRSDMDATHTRPGIGPHRRSDMDATHTRPGIGPHRRSDMDATHTRPGIGPHRRSDMDATHTRPGIGPHRRSDMDATHTRSDIGPHRRSDMGLPHRGSDMGPHRRSDMGPPHRGSDMGPPHRRSDMGPPHRRSDMGPPHRGSDMGPPHRRSDMGPPHRRSDMGPPHRGSDMGPPHRRSDMGANNDRPSHNPGMKSKLKRTETSSQGERKKHVTYSDNEVDEIETTEQFINRLFPPTSPLLQASAGGGGDSNVTDHHQLVPACSSHPTSGASRYDSIISQIRNRVQDINVFLTRSDHRHAHHRISRNRKLAPDAVKVTPPQRRKRSGTTTQQQRKCCGSMTSLAARIPIIQHVPPELEATTIDPIKFQSFSQHIERVLSNNPKNNNSSTVCKGESRKVTFCSPRNKELVSDYYAWLKKRKGHDDDKIDELILPYSHLLCTPEPLLSSARYASRSRRTFPSDSTAEKQRDSSLGASYQQTRRPTSAPGTANLLTETDLLYTPPPKAADISLPPRKALMNWSSPPEMRGYGELAVEVPPSHGK